MILINKHRRLVTIISTVLIVSIIYFISCETKKLSPTGPVEVGSILEQIDLSGWEDYCSLLKDFNETGEIPAELDTIVSRVSTYITEIDSQFFIDLNHEEISDFIDSVNYVSQQEMELMKKGDEETINNISERITSLPPELESAQFDSLLEKISNDSILKEIMPYIIGEYPPISLSRVNTDKRLDNLSLKSSSYGNRNNIKSNNRNVSLTCEEVCWTKYGACVALATAAAAAALLEAHVVTMACIAAAIAAAWLIILAAAAIALCIAAYAAVHLLIERWYQEALQSCENSLIACLKNCTQGGGANP